MPEPINPGDGVQPNNQGNPQGTDPKQTPSSGAPATVDISKIGDEEFAKIFEDPRLWTHPRFKNLNDRAKKAEELEQKAKADEEARLIKNKEYEELSKKRESERDEWKNKYSQSLQDNALILEASKIGVVDTGAVLKLVNREGLTIADNGTVIGADQAVKALIDNSPWLKKGGSNAPTIGSPTNPGGNTSTAKFKLSQINDPAFYRAHEKEIMEAYKNGNIEDDR